MTVLVGIAGGTCSGKTSLAVKIRDRVGEDRCLLIAQDSYYKDGSTLTPAAQASINYDHPDAFDSSLLVQDLRDLKSGRPVPCLTYDHATVCVQGRSYSVGSSVTFTVQNQLNKCGATGSMANDWSIHSTGVDLGTCIVGNNEFQGLRIFASGGSGALSLTRLRFTLHGAVY